MTHPFPPHIPAGPSVQPDPATATGSTDLPRRRWLTSVAALGTLPLGAPAASAASAPATQAQAVSDAEASHKIVYQLNRADEAYQEAILNSISALLKKYVDDVNIAVVVWGPGIHLLAKHPQRPVPPLFQQRVRSMAESYGVRFIACGNTMHSLNWSKADMLDLAEIQDVGAAAIMELQEQGHAYLAW